MIGAPVRLWVSAIAFMTRSTPGVNASSIAHLRNAALIDVPAMPVVMSSTNMSTIGSSPPRSVPGPRK
jgi:hypothetical protein